MGSRAPRFLIPTPPLTGSARAFAAQFPQVKLRSNVRGLSAVTLANAGSTLLVLAEHGLLRSTAGATDAAWLPAPDGARVLATGPTHVAIGGAVVALFDPATSELRVLPRPEGSPIVALEWTRDGARLAAFGEGEVDVFGPGGFERRVVDPAFANGRGCITPSGRLAGFDVDHVVLFDASSGARTGEHAPIESTAFEAMLGTREALVLAFARQDKRYAFDQAEHVLRFVREDGELICDQIGTARVVRDATLPTDRSEGRWWGKICVSPDGTEVAASGYDLEAQLFDAVGSPQPSIKREVSNPPVALAVGDGWFVDATSAIAVVPCRSRRKRR